MQSRNTIRRDHFQIYIPPILQKGSPEILPITAQKQVEYPFALYLLGNLFVERHANQKR